VKYLVDEMMSGVVSKPLDALASGTLDRFVHIL
jgi:hypothetical protein